MGRVEDLRLRRERAQAAIRTPRTSAKASLAEAPSEGKMPSWSAASLAAPARREAMDPTRREWRRRKGRLVREAK